MLAASDLAGIMRRMRSCLLDTLRAEYVTAARARGLGEGWVIYKHALRNAINPLLTIFGYSLAALLSGAFIVENIMAWPGLGRLTMEAFFAKDSYLVVDCVVMATALLVIGNFIADLLLAWSDPRNPIEMKMLKQIRSGTGVSPVCFNENNFAPKTETHGRDTRATKF